MRHHFTIGSLIAIAALLAVPLRAIAGQAAGDGREYVRSSLDIVPRLAGLAVVRGASEERVASLPFLWPTRVARVFGDDSVSSRHAANATRRRTLAALFTDLGGVLVIAGVTRVNGAGRSVLGTGAAIVAASVPIQFAADAELSRAVWAYNRRFAR